MFRQILVCDDEPHIVRAISLKLTRAGFDLKSVSDVEVCWRLLQRAEMPELLIVDRSFPCGADGVDLVRWIRQDVRLVELPVLMLFASEAEMVEQQEVVAELRLSQTLAKPFSPRELVESVNALFGRESGSRIKAHSLVQRASDCRL